MSEKPEDIGLDNKSSTERDRIDMNHEISGEPTGRIQRFLSENSRDIYGVSEKKKSERAYRTMLEMLLAEDAQYAALYSQVTEKLEKAYQAVDQALIDINQRLEASVEKLQFLRENATELKDGTKVFRSENNSVFTENGKKLSKEETQNLQFSDNAPSWEEYKAEKETREALLRDRKKLTDYKYNTLDDIDRRMKDEDDPISKDELKDLQDNFPNLPVLETRSINMSAQYSANSSSVASSLETDPNQPTNTISSAFEKAHDGILDLAELDAIAPQRTSTPAP